MIMIRSHNQWFKDNACLDKSTFFFKKLKKRKIRDVLFIIVRINNVAALLKNKSLKGSDYLKIVIIKEDNLKRDGIIFMINCYLIYSLVEMMNILHFKW